MYLRLLKCTHIGPQPEGRQDTVNDDNTEEHDENSEEVLIAVVPGKPDTADLELRHYLNNFDK